MQDLGWKVHDREKSLFCTHTLCMSYVTNTFLWLVPQYGVNNYCVLCTIKAKKSEQKSTTKRFVGFHNHSPPNYDDGNDFPVCWILIGQFKFRSAS